MEKAIKLIITEEASEFSQESNATMENYNITPAFCSKDGEELLNRIKAEQPDVVLMDSFMTRLDAIVSDVEVKQLLNSFIYDQT